MIACCRVQHCSLMTRFGGSFMIGEYDHFCADTSLGQRTPCRVGGMDDRRATQGELGAVFQKWHDTPFGARAFNLFAFNSGDCHTIYDYQTQRFCPATFWVPASGDQQLAWLWEAQVRRITGNNPKPCR